MTSHIQPEASLEKNLIDFLLKKPVYISTGHARELKDFIHQAIEEAVETERKRIEEVVKGLELDEQFIGPLFNAGHSAALGKVLSLINPQE